MLKLKRVELQGFKSFLERTELKFHGSGIAAIVGPNGCGKSNLADAINWVLGEQSAKSLRGARMEDVIFAGTRDRKPLGLASVTITLTDPGFHLAGAPTNGKTNGAALHIEDAAAAVTGANGKSVGHGQEITITRRLFRSGESEYLIDGRMARLRDIQDIFMGTGLGPESYAIIEQGRIGQLLSSRPQDRRAVIEEAAGISKFKSRRRLAEAKLEGARHNLERVFDILEEVGRQANALKRQAAKARRYGELKSDMDAQLRRVLAGRFRMLERETAKIALDLNLANAGLASLAGQSAARESEHSGAQESLYRVEADLTAARKALADLDLELERARGRLGYQTTQVASIEQRATQAAAESEELGVRSAKLEQELAAQRESALALDAQAEAARERLADKDQERGALQQQLGEKERTIETARQQALRILGEASTLRNQIAQLDAFAAALDRDAAKAAKEEQAAESDIEWIDASRAEFSEKLAARQLELESLGDRRKRVEQELAARKDRLSKTRAELETSRAESSRIKARRDSLEEVLSHRTYTTESVKRLFTAIDRGQASGLRPLGVLADFVEVEPAYEKAAEEFLRDELEYIVVENWDQAECGVEVLRGGIEGRATFLVHPEPGSHNGNAPAPGGASGVTSRLGDVLRLTNGLSGAALDCLPRLARCFLVDDRPSAQRLAIEYPELYFLVSDGVCYHGRAVTGGRKTSGGPLALKRELRELRTQFQAREKQIEETAGRAQSLEREIARLEEELERVRGSQQSEEKEALAIDHEMRKLAEELARANSRLSLARLELERLAGEKERAREQNARDRAALEEKEEARAAQESALELARREIDALRAEGARIHEEHSTLRADLAGLEERRRAERAAMSRVEAQLQELADRTREIAADLERQTAERARLLASNIELDRRIAEVSGDRGRTETSVNELAADETSLRAGLAAIEETLKTLRTELQDAQQKRSQAEIELVRRQAELKFLDETSVKELNAPVADLAAAEEIVPDEAALAELEARHAEIKKRIEALGPVNPEALAEYREAQQRFDFLSAQRQDLLDSIRDTEKAIQEIDVETRKRFADAFAAINANFREVFVTLFGGGIGEMRLTDEANAADSGIDIVASPPGKRLQNVLLLSGGEKALTALALLMAVFRYQPSPFCILDEVDAPLDEPNIQRLTRLLREMSRQTQVIIITHAKRTMEAAEMLYGVTMQEPGVSRLVSVKFQGQMPPPETQAPLFANRETGFSA